MLRQCRCVLTQQPLLRLLLHLLLHPRRLFIGFLILSAFFLLALLFRLLAEDFAIWSVDDFLPCLLCFFDICSLLLFLVHLLQCFLFALHSFEIEILEADLR